MKAKRSASSGRFVKAAKPFGFGDRCDGKSRTGKRCTKTLGHSFGHSFARK